MEEISDSILKAEKLMDDGYFSEAIKEAGYALEILMKEVYRKILDNLTTDELQRMCEVQKKIGENRPVEQYMLGELIGLFSQSNLFSKISKHLVKRDLTFFTPNELNKINKLRVDCTHHGYKASKSEALATLNSIKAMSEEFNVKLPQVKEIEEEDIIAIVKGNPFILEEVIGEEVLLIEPPLINEAPELTPDAKFVGRSGKEIFVEVEYKQLHPNQIIKYKSKLLEKLRVKKTILIWFVPDDLKIDTDFERMLTENQEVLIVRYKKTLYEEWARIRKESQDILRSISRLISSPFTYTVGRKGASFDWKFDRGPIDALYFYGYINDGKKKRKVGFHLATLGWNLDLIRVLASENSKYFTMCPDLVLKVICEVLRAPFWYDDPKATASVPSQYRAMGKVVEGGFVEFIKGYKKRGKIEEIKEIISEIDEITWDFYNKKLRPNITKFYPKTIHNDLLARIGTRLFKDNKVMDFVGAFKIRDALIEGMALECTPLTESIRSPDGIVIENRSARDKGTYSANMGRRIIELLCLKRVFTVHTRVNPAYRVLLYAGNQFKLTPVESFKLGDLSLFREILPQ
jgi:hypothetical protein